MSQLNPDRLFKTPFLDKQGGASGISWAWIKFLQEVEVKVRNTLTLLGQIASTTPVQGRSEGIGTTLQNLSAAGKLSGAGVNFSLDSVPDGSRAAWTTVAQRAAAVDASGNILLKNISQAVGSTSGPTTSSITYGDLAEMTVTITTKGNPILVIFSGVASTNGVGYYTVVLDGSIISPEFTTAATSAIPISLTYLDQPAAGAHTYKIQFKTDNVAHNFTFAGVQRTLQVLELG